MVENVVDYLILIGLCQFTAYLHCNFGEVSSFARKKLFFFRCISTVVFHVNNACGVFLLRVRVVRGFLLLEI